MGGGSRDWKGTSSRRTRWSEGMHDIPDSESPAMAGTLKALPSTKVHPHWRRDCLDYCIRTDLQLASRCFCMVLLQRFRIRLSNLGAGCKGDGSHVRCTDSAFLRASAICLLVLAFCRCHQFERGPCCLECVRGGRAQVRASHGDAGLAQILAPTLWAREP